MGRALIKHPVAAVAVQAIAFVTAGAGRAIETRAKAPRAALKPWSLTMLAILRAALIWAAFLGLGLLGGMGFRHYMSPTASPEIAAVDRSTPGLPAADQLVLVSLSTCPACAKARQWLSEQNQAYVEFSIDQSREAKALADRLGINAVPVLILGNRSIRGFDGDTFAREIQAWRAAATPSA